MGLVYQCIRIQISWKYIKRKPIAKKKTRSRGSGRLTNEPPTLSNTHANPRVRTKPLRAFDNFADKVAPGIVSKKPSFNDVHDFFSFQKRLFRTQ